MSVLGFHTLLIITPEGSATSQICPFIPQLTNVCDPGTCLPGACTKTVSSPGEVPDRDGPCSLLTKYQVSMLVAVICDDKLNFKKKTTLYI